MDQFNYFVLGFLWGIGRKTDQKTFIVQYNNETVMKMIRDIVSPNQIVFPVKVEKGKTSYRLKLNIHNAYVDWMQNHGYKGRKNKHRNIPVFETMEQEAEFLRGYFFPHHTRDIIKRNQKDITRLRFYASEPILDRLNLHLHQALDTTLKTVQSHGRSDVCHILYFLSPEEVSKIIRYLRLKEKNEDKMTDNC